MFHSFFRLCYLQVAHGPDDLIKMREEIITGIENLGHKLKSDGISQRWFDACDEKTKFVCRNVNGPLFKNLLRKAGHCDIACADLFRKGQ